MFEDANWSFNNYKGKIDGFEEATFGINEIHNLYTSTDEIRVGLDKVNNQLYNMDRLEEYEDIIDLSHDLGRNIDRLIYDLEEYDNTINEVLEWGEGWKKLALRLFEDGNFDLNDYVEVMK